LTNQRCFQFEKSKHEKLAPIAASSCCGGGRHNRYSE